ACTAGNYSEISNSSARQIFHRVDFYNLDRILGITVIILQIIIDLKDNENEQKKNKREKEQGY
ncbi:MAG: hypothetical protein NTZ51_02825, partial [Proteobacteria bacterium]|nr:hypothetical protein [Pseudomonadota bacterium]